MGLFVEKLGSGHLNGPIAEHEVLDDILSGDFGGFFVHLGKDQTADHGQFNFNKLLAQFEHHFLDFFADWPPCLLVINFKFQFHKLS